MFYFLNSGSGQLKYLRSRVRPRNWTQGSSMDDVRFRCFCCVATGLGEVEGVAIEGYYRICSRSGCFFGPSNGYGKSLCYACLPLLFDHLYQLEDSQTSIVIIVTPLTATIRPGKSSLISLFFYAISFYLEISSPQPIQYIAESSTSFSDLI